MSEPVIRLENISKRYLIGHMRPKGDGIRHVVEEAVRAPVKWLRGQRKNSKLEQEEFWALRDVSFEVKQGEVLGIIGRNGAGKSTLLKILSRITEPTAGRISIEGRVASLLEVGTGFHSELSGRENIFLNGAILGMSRVEIKRKFDEIVAFSEVERFLDTPVKRYSSGMYVRLAFAVAAHLEPEILIVDEVLAVGDVDFQKKCLGKMQDVSTKEGRTVLFVSHNMLAVQKLCTKALLLVKGSVKAAGQVNEIVAEYASSGESDTYANLKTTDQPQIVEAKIITASPRTDMPLEILVEWVLPRDMPGLKVGLGINTTEGQRIFDSAPEDTGMASPDRKGRYKALFIVPPNSLLARRYAVSIGLWRGSVVFDHPNPALAFSTDPAPSGPYSHQDTRDGMVNIHCTWELLPSDRR
jgi:lipopolysaccharide transport system ATP-binding protein